MDKERKKYLEDIKRTPFLALGVILISAIAVFFETPMLIPIFSGSLFTIIIFEESKFSHPKNIIFAHGISFFLAMFAAVILNGLEITPMSYGGIAIIGALVLIASLIQTTTKLEHPPAIAAILVLFEIDLSSENIVLGFIPFNLLLSFTFALLIVVAIARLIDSKKTKDGFIK